MTNKLLAASTEQLAAVIYDVIVDHPMWIGDDGEPLDYLPEREARLGDFINEAVAALVASGAVVPAASLADDMPLVDRLTEYLHEECDMGGAATFHTANLLRALAAALEDR